MYVELGKVLHKVQVLQHYVYACYFFFQELIGLDSLSSKILLPLSTMVHAYCRVNPECSEVAEVKAVINELERNIQGGCNVDQQNFRQVHLLFLFPTNLPSALLKSIELYKPEASPAGTGH